ncbi:MAG: C13 family peptidase [Xanthobacteraceae bacterium]
MWQVLKLAARAIVWRTTPDPPLAGLPVLLGFALVTAVVRAALQLLAASPEHGFNPYGLNALVAWIALELAVAALFVRPANRVTALSAMLVLSIVAEVVTTGLSLGVPAVTPAIEQSPLWTDPIAAYLIYALAVVWWVGAMATVVGSLEPQLRLRLIGKAAALWVALFVANALVPQAPVFLPPDFDARNANWWEFLYALHHDKNGEARITRSEIARLEKSQPALLKAELAGLAPPRQGVTDVYALGVAGWADQDVFGKELDGGLQAIANVLPIKERTVRLINRRDTLATVPLANFQNFKAAVEGIGSVMNKDRDILVLFMTSHGEKTGFALELPGGVAELTPQQVAATLDGAGIKNRIVIVSACFSGIFVPLLKNADTIVITASDANNTSFGCAPERDWTYFGDAFFRQSLHPGTNFESAFDQARILIQGWELMDHATPSNPQGAFGPALVGKLAPIFAAAQTAAQ